MLAAALSPQPAGVSSTSNTSFESGTNSEDIKKASVLLIRKLYTLMQNLGPLPNDVILTMTLHYYNAVTPNDYQPPGFKEGVSSHFLLFEGEPVNLQVGMVSTGFHSMKVKVTAEATRVSDLQSSLFQESDTTEIAHQGLDCDEEEEERNPDACHISELLCQGQDRQTPLSDKEKDSQRGPVSCPRSRSAQLFALDTMPLVLFDPREHVEKAKEAQVVRDVWESGREEAADRIHVG
ncbi:hypothetical protein MG293_013816 [Ovis ammon polii]|uniref:HORMA domain-containing protein n=1 Tax=Ovis ammon polii TaxID=230172 RepID=A0AAD4Y682_OVIAM|nr:hypothetical protein MG293_013816 [Ovis ammon polii]